MDGPPSFTGYVRDITERRVSEDALSKVRSELAHVTRMSSLGALTASIAHEVNQPLSGIITNASTCLRMLAAEPPNVDGALETARRTIRDGNRAADVITRLRALFSKEGVATGEVDLNEAAREVIALCWGELQSARVMLRTELAGELPFVTGDRVQLQQVILNLLLNAADAMSGVEDRPRQLTVATGRDENDHVRLTVQDAGEGVRPPGRQSAVRSVLHHQERRHGHWPVRQPLDHREPSRPPVGGAERRSRRHLSFSIPSVPERATGAPDIGAMQTPAVTDAKPVMRSPL